MTESDFIKAIQLLFPQGNPLRELADLVSDGNNIDKITSLLFIKDRLESEYRLASIAQILYQTQNYSKYLTQLTNALSECNTQLNQLTNRIIQDEAQKKTLDKIRLTIKQGGF